MELCPALAYISIPVQYADKRNQDRLRRYAGRQENIRELKREANDATAQARQVQEEAKTTQKQVKDSVTR